jgi:glutaminase
MQGNTMTTTETSRQAHTTVITNDLAVVVGQPSQMAITNHLATDFWLLSGMASSFTSSSISLADGAIASVTMVQAKTAAECSSMKPAFFNESGYWVYTKGLPAMTGVDGGIVTTVPGQ